MAKLNTKIVMLEGEQGKDGTNIKSVEKSASDGLTDTYTITLTDGSKSSFNVTNGKGISSISKTGASGLDDIYTITYNDGTTSTFTVPNGKATDLVQSQIVPTASIESGETASKAYNVGDFLAKDFILYKVTKAIAEGDALTVGDNIASETIAEGLNSIQNQIVPTASIESGETASKAYNVGDFLVKDGTLFKVTNAIAKGDALTVGTNIAITTVGGGLSEIKSSLSDITQLSLDAVAVGKDEDGDTIYEKTFKGSTISDNDETVVDSSLTISNLKWIRLVGGCFNDSNAVINTLPYDVTIVNSGTRSCFQVFSNTKGLVVECWEASVKMYHFTVQYVLK